MLEVKEIYILQCLKHMNDLLISKFTLVYQKHKSSQYYAKRLF